MSQFQWPVTVYIEDTDAGGIVYYVNYLKYMERARSEWLRRYDVTQQALLQTGIQLVVHRLDCRYVKPARLDEQLQVSVSVESATSCRLCFHQEVTRRGEGICDARVDIACIDAARGKPTRWPTALAAAIHG
ncbi:tol-pal system-associated acyl-CoA thioesterase [Aidingimonas halophila]|uniref:4-hydroxybenzoyl-CoA thioesterase/acyl-CoA thioester hydrolase n=1 Tax=Aidingimonas halophila TaxID=574349 RepID=A0A1H3BQ73_9GAMM|nr:tol-pal system-associated acyl-CoA thioesterase [Aidingimonas halophila]GHC26966.1 tol-pal system-associated acyl-CoA thioesterase [Aidingimonas halophila]SDX44122.1 4-hydroxybenzoyl-CoA thioesterase/acyl-CoA thioester hydrolase [Aidingimonas halophila]